MSNSEKLTEILAGIATGRNILFYGKEIVEVRTFDGIHFPVIHGEPIGNLPITEFLNADGVFNWKNVTALASGTMNRDSTKCRIASGSLITFNVDPEEPKITLDSLAGLLSGVRKNFDNAMQETLSNKPTVSDAAVKLRSLVALAESYLDEHDKKHGCGKKDEHRPETANKYSAEVQQLIESCISDAEEMERDVKNVYEHTENAADVQKSRMLDEVDKMYKERQTCLRHQWERTFAARGMEVPRELADGKFEPLGAKQPRSQDY